MDFQTWIDNIEGLAGIYSFDILPDGSFSEIRLMAVNQQNMGIITQAKNAPDFYPGIPYRTYWSDINFESFVYKCGSTGQPLYSYVNAHGYWLKGFYLPMTEPGTVSLEVENNRGESTVNTVYCLYILNYSNNFEADSMSQHSHEVSSTVMNISLKLHETEDFHRAMAETVKEIQNVCGAEKCSLYTVDSTNQHCTFINKNGVQNEFLGYFSEHMGRSPYDVAMTWEKDLESSDCLLLDDLSVIEKRDPVWHKSLIQNGIKNIILYAVRNNQQLVGFIWAANFDTSKMAMIKETLELTTFLIGAVIANHQLVSRLELMSRFDILTQVNNRNALNERMSQLSAEAPHLPHTLGLIYADLNGLKSVNDKMGHDAGDKLLSKAASLLKIAFGDFEIYRAGGDEFVIICPDIAEYKFYQQVGQLRALMESAPDVNFAIGAAHCSGKYDIQDAMLNADEQMYKDKAEYYRRHPENDRRNLRRS